MESDEDLENLSSSSIDDFDELEENISKESQATSKLSNVSNSFHSVDSIPYLRIQAWKVAIALATIIVLLLLSFFLYTHFFYLPSTNEVIIPGGMLEFRRIGHLANCHREIRRIWFISEN